MNSAFASAQLQHLIGNETSAAENRTQVTQQLADKFQALYEHGRMAAPRGNHADTETMVSKLVQQQDLETQAIANDVLYMTKAMPHLSIQQSYAAGMQVQLETASMQCDLQVKLAVVTSTKDAIGSLMRNQ